MKNAEVCVADIKIAELRKRFRQILELKTPRIVKRNTRVVGLLFSVEGSWYGTIENPTAQKRRLRAEFEAVLARIAP